jgi:AcrR family transcriptional regulator
VSTPQRRTQEERRAESDEAIRLAAIELFADQGYLKTTLSQVGQKAGYTAGLISNRLGSKENLLKLVLQSISDGFLKNQLPEVIDEADVVASLHTIVESYLTSVADETSAIRALYSVMGEAIGGVPEVKDDIARFNELTRNSFVALVGEGVESGQISSSVNPESAGLVILALIRGMTMQYLADPGSHPISNVIHETQAAIDAYLKK